MMGDAGKHPSATTSAHGDHVHHEDCKHAHVHSSSGGHDHAPTTSSGSGMHYHGDTPCSHAHPHAPQPPKGKSNAGVWIAGIAAVAGIGACFINEYGKPKGKETTPKPDDWKHRIEPRAASEARTL